MIYLILGLVIFLGVHSVRMFAPAFRNGQVAKGAGRWKGIYTALSIIGIIAIGSGYASARLDNVFLYEPPIWLKHIQFLLMIPALVLFVASQFPAGRIKKAVKNPMLIGVKIWAFSHLLVNGDLASLLLFGSFLVWAVMLNINTKRRGQTFPDETNTMADIISVIGGVVLWAAFVFFLHEWLIGVSVIA